MRRLLLIFALLGSLPAWATWGVVQHTCNAACAAGASCTITTSATGANNLIVVGLIGDGAGTPAISGVSGGGTYAHSTIAANNGVSGIDMSYTTASAAGSTSTVVSVSPSATNSWRACMTEFSSSTGGIALDTGATPQAKTTISSAAPVGPALTVSGANLAVVSLIFWGGTITGASSPYNANGDQPNGNGWANAINISAGTGIAWTPTTSNSGLAASIAFKENASSSTATQTHFKFRNDDGSESAATDLAAQDTNVTQPLSTNTRLRTQVDTSGALGAQTFQLEWKKSTDAAYRAVSTAPSPVVYTICASGCTSTTAFVAPADVFTAKVECWGGGGGGSRAAANSTPGGGGKGGSYAKVNAMPLTPGTTYTPTIGAGGVSSTAAAGGATDFIGDSSTHCTAAGGVTPAVSSTTGSTTVNGTSVGDVINAGGNGANGSGTVAGGGGEAGGSSTVGAAASTSTGGSGNNTDGGDGGNGRTASNGVGSPGVAPGGAGGGALRVSTTSNNGGAGAAGQITITYTATPAILLGASANIAGSAATSTTALLSVPNSHSFFAGRISDDTNPLPSLTVTSTNYTELEWSLQAISPAVNGSIYTFRVTKAGTALDTYSVTPQWTIGTVGGAVSRRRVWVIQ